jgi:S-adenosyl methyltransferase
MTGDFFRSVLPESEDEAGLPGIDTSVAHIARVYDYWLGGKDYFAADRKVGDQVLEIHPETALSVRANRAFLARAVRYLTARGIRQFLDVGTGLPTADNTHEVAQAAAPTSRVVYVDNDPIVLAHARALLASGPQGATAYLDADVREPEKILSGHVTRATLDLTEPIALMLVALLHFIPDEDDPRHIMRTLVDALPSGSYVVASHATAEHNPEAVSGAQRAYIEGGVRGALRTSEEFADLAFSGLELVDPGVVLVSEWRPDGASLRPAASEVNMYGAVARKP